MVLYVSFSTSLKCFTNFPILDSILLQVSYLVKEHNTFSGGMQRRLGLEFEFEFELEFELDFELQFELNLIKPYFRLMQRGNTTKIISIILPIVLSFCAQKS